MPLFFALALACTRTVSAPDRVEPTFLYVELLEGQTGSAEAPLPFTTEAQTLRLRVSAQDLHGDPYPLNGDLTVKVLPGVREGSPWLEMVDGVWEGEVQLRNGFGPTRVWISDEGDKDETSGRRPSYATGVTEPIWYVPPTLAELNRTDDHETNQLEKQFTELLCEGRDVRVSAVGTAGFWVTDLADPAGSYNNLFVYTFSRPDEDDADSGLRGVYVGRRLQLLTGANQEYLATTQLSFPKYEVSDDAEVDMPAPAELDLSSCGMNDVLEGYESGLVTLNNVRVPSTFTTGSEDHSDYLAYGQWPVVFNEGDRCAFYVDSGVSNPDFVPQAGTELTQVTGMLFEVWGKWILLPRDADDLGLSAAAGPPGPGGSLGRPLPRPRPAAIPSSEP